MLKRGFVAHRRNVNLKLYVYLKRDKRPKNLYTYITQLINWSDQQFPAKNRLMKNNDIDLLYNDFG